MTSLPATTDDANRRTSPGKVTGRLKTAIDAMVWDAATRPDAAKAAGLTDHGLRQALRRPHVVAYYRAELEVLRTSERARNLAAAIEVRDQRDNQTARMQAIKWLDEEPEHRGTTAAGQRVAPGVVVVVNLARDGSRMADEAVIELNPMDAVEPAADDADGDA